MTTTTTNLFVGEQVHANYLTTMQSLFQNVVEKADPPPFHDPVTLRTASGNHVYTDEVTLRQYKHDPVTNTTSWLKEGEVVVEGKENEV